MNTYHDAELDDVLQDSELRRIASLLHTARAPEPPLDDAFRTGLRRQLMQAAWATAEGRDSWWRRAFAPPGIAWAGAIAGVLLIAAVAIYFSNNGNGSSNEIVVGSAVDNKNNVALVQPILLSFNQPMDHQSTQDAVQITPATTVGFAWDQQSRVLTVTPTSGNLAPNTQYQVTIGPGAKTANNVPLATPQTITFVTQAPTATPAPPTPRPTPANPLGEKQIAPLSGAGTLAALWSADSTSIYFIDGKGALQVFNLKTGTTSTISTQGVTSLAISPAGDRLAYLQAPSKIEVLTFASGKTDEIVPNPAAMLVGWAKDQVIWAAADGVYGGGAQGSLGPLPAAGQIHVISIAPDGAHALYSDAQNVVILDLATGKGTRLGQNSSDFAFEGWSPDGSLLLYANGDHNVIADTTGQTQGTLPTGPASWSSQDAVLIGGDTALLELRPDGSNATRIGTGTYRSPVWAPDGSTFAFVRGDSLWTAGAPALPPEPTPVDQAAAVVSKFMDARLHGSVDGAMAVLDDNARKAYGQGGLSLLINGDARFSRYYVLTQEQIGTGPDTVRFVVRLVLSHGKLDVSELEETLTLVRDGTGKQFLVDQATGSAHRDLGKGPELVTVAISASAVQVTFDSDLDPATTEGSVVILDSKGNQVDATVTYSNRAVTLTGLDLKAGAQYKLVVLNSVRDVADKGVSAEYDLALVGPVTAQQNSHRPVTGPSPSPSPSPSPGASTGQG